MKDVQLLVVDRQSLAERKPRLCNVGESGEIYVRAGGLGIISFENPRRIC